MASQQVSVPTATPPGWANYLMKLMLKTPLLQRFIGRGLMLLTFTGRKSGSVYTIPVSYARSGNHVLAVTKLFRTWWKNLVEGADVSVRLAGKDFAGKAWAAQGDEAQYDILHRYLVDRPIDAKAYGVRRVGGELVEEDVRALLPQLVLIDIELQAG